MKKKAKTTKSLLAPPRHLSAEAGQIWAEVTRYLAANGRLEPTDSGVIEGYCMAVTRQRRLQSELDRAGIVGADGKPHAILRTAESTAATVQNYARALGLSPAARKTLPAKQSEPDRKGSPWRGVLD